MPINPGAKGKVGRARARTRFVGGGGWQGGEAAGGGAAWSGAAPARCPRRRRSAAGRWGAIVKRRRFEPVHNCACAHPRRQAEPLVGGNLWGALLSAPATGSARPG